MKRRGFFAALAGVSRAAGAQCIPPDKQFREPELVLEVHLTESMVLSPGVAEAFAQMEVLDAICKGRLKRYGEAKAEELAHAYHEMQRQPRATAQSSPKCYWPAPQKGEYA